ncbi:uncharacterized protein BXZ73DRAFT_99011 [Epithele typhae]|uniref:uncharacterized protein n=1 Tax=Epithele typhae TaxID=378194 RepID=UPI0020084D8F|nr:uncharacterized protein BXZ73DRAFT_99011 [Epithele typhae]KAH9940015.1 hypothetical protein BXZ73DRAFT_99011 [Epithele typhae]
MASPRHSIVASLPQELLAHIFTMLKHVMAADAAEGDGILADEFQNLYSFGWTHVVQVCREWRDVAHQTAALWCDIDVPHPSYPRLRGYPSTGAFIQRLQVILPRTCGSALQLSFHSLELLSKASLQDLFKDPSRIRSLQVPKPFLVNNLHDLEPRLDVLNLPMPLLEELDVRSKLPIRPPPSPPPVSVDFSDARYPRLRSLRILRINFTSVTALRNLHVLDLRLCTFDNELASGSDLLKLLDASPNLQVLCLHHVLSQLKMDLPSAPLKDLTALRKLDLFDAPDKISLFLSWFSFRPDIAIHLGTPTEPIDNLADLVAAFNAPLPADRSRFPMLAAADFGSADADATLTLTARGPSDPSKPDDDDARLGALTLALPRADVASHLCTLGALLPAFRSVFAGAPLRRLVLSGDFRSVAAVPLRALLLDFPHVRSLRCASLGTALPAICALGLPLGAPDSTGSASDPLVAPTALGPARRFAVPHLGELDFDALDWGLGTMEALTAVLRARTEGGARRLGRLRMNLCAEGEVEGEDARASVRAYRGQIEPTYVDKLEFQVAVYEYFLD